MARSNTIKYFSIYFLCYCQRLKKNDPSFIEEEEELHNNISKEAKNHHIVFLWDRVRKTDDWVGVNAKFDFPRCGKWKFQNSVGK
jgi:hypothetical protein